jgi:hypothetical protein
MLFQYNKIQKIFSFNKGLQKELERVYISKR